MPDPIAIFCIALTLAWSLLAAYSYHRGMHP